MLPCVQHTDLTTTSAATDLAQVRRAVRERGVAPVARDLEVSRSTLTSVLAGTAREGSVTLVAKRAMERLGGGPRAA